MRSSKLVLGALAVVTIAACGTTSDPSNPGLTQTPLISECGGFLGQAKVEPPAPDPATYCEAERLLWTYDAEAGSLGLTNARIVLNCCGEHSIEVREEDGTYVIAERDAPELVEGMEARCNCSCVFDFGVSVEGIEAGVIDVRIVRDVTDDMESEKVVYEGKIDLSEVQGAITVDPTSADPWCGTP
jgi:hypothetical protein